MSVVRIVEGVWLAKAMSVVIRLGIPDLLVDGPRSVDELASLTASHSSSLHRVMRARAGQGVFECVGGTRFALTESSSVLLPWAKLMLGEVHQGAWENLAYAVQTGESAFSHTYGVDLWRYCASNPAHARLFAAAMAEFTTTYIRGLLANYSFSKFGNIVDVGGGDGRLLVEILVTNPASRGILFERPEVVVQARLRISQAQLESRCEAVSGDALIEVPSGGDVYLLSRVLHDWDDAGARAILSACAAAMGTSGRILVIERVMPASAEDLAALPASVVSDMQLTDLNMMVMTTGRERSLREYEVLFESAGLRLAAVVPTATSISVLEAIA